MQKHNNFSKQNIFLYIVAFIVPCVLIGIAMWKNGVYPFGDKSVFLWDLELQHKDYYSYLWDVLHGEANLQYSFSKSLGGRMIGIVAFYVSSIFNIALLFIEKQQIVSYLSYVTILRISLSGMFCAFYLNRRFQLKRYLVLCLAVSYAMMEYNVCYCRNPMWMDGVMFLPLVCCGVYYVTTQRKGGLLWGSVALSILCNWYTGYMICLMSGIYCLFEILILQDFNGKNWKDLCKKFARYMSYALLGVLASAVILLPACVSLVGGKASFRLLTFKQNMPLSQVLDGFALTAPYNKSTAPLLYCGGFVLFAVIFGLINREIPVKKRIGYAVLLLVLLISYSSKDASLLWTAFVESTSYYFRFSFVSGWIMVVIAADILNECKNRKFGDIAPALLGTMIVLALVLDTNINDRKVIFYLILAEGYAFWIAMLILVKCRKMRVVIYALLGSCLFFELTWNASEMFKEYHIKVADYERYVVDMGDIVREVQAMDEDEFRMEKTYSFLNISRTNSPVATGESLMFGYKSIENYSSAYDGVVDDFLANLGYSDYPGRQVFRCETYWNSSMLPADSLLGIRYVLDTVKPYGYEEVTIGKELPEGYHLYRNDSALPLAFSSDLVETVMFDKNPFHNQNLLYTALTGYESHVYRELVAKSMGSEGAYERYVIDVDADGPIYIFVDEGGIHSSLYNSNCELWVNGEKIQNICHRFEINAMYIGDYQIGDRVELEIRRNKEQKDHKLYLSQLQVDEFYNVIEELRQKNSVEELKIEGNHVYAVSRSDHPTDVIFSIPYDAGWKIRVNGDTVQSGVFAESLIRLSLDAGENVIEMTYTTPGLYAGIICSLIGVIGFIWMRKYRF